MMELSSDQLKLEDELEKTINMDMEISMKVSVIKNLLARITANEASIVKFTTMVSNPNENNNPN